MTVDCAAYTALYDYNSTDDRDLTFSAGDLITVHQMNGAWWMGSIADRSGMFPANYVTPLLVCLFTAALCNIFCPCVLIMFTLSCAINVSHLYMNGYKPDDITVV